MSYHIEHYKYLALSEIAWTTKKNQQMKLRFPYMFISVKIKFQISFIILPEVVYNYSCPMIFQGIELHETKNNK